MLLCQDFVKFDETNQNHSRDNSKVSNFLHSDVFTAFWSFPSYPDHYLIENSAAPHFVPHKVYGKGRQKPGDHVKYFYEF